MADKNSTEAVIEQDLVLVYVEDKPAFFARVEGFTPDHKPNWWHVELLVLQIPVRLISWILRREQLNGEPFTMGGTPVRIEKVRPPREKTQEGTARQEAESPAPPEDRTDVRKPGAARILTFGGRNREKDSEPPDDA